MPRSSYAGIFPGLAALALALLTGCGEPAKPLAAPARGDALPGADAGRGRARIAEYGCVSCHAIPGVRGPGARVGPPLRHLASRAYLAGVLPNTPANLMHWLRHPTQVDPLSAMPDLGVTEQDARDMAAFLYTLGGDR